MRMNNSGNDKGQSDPEKIKAETVEEEEEDVDNSNNKEQNLFTLEELMSPQNANLAKREEQRSDQILGALTWPDRFRKVANACAFAFILFGFLLNWNGYGYVRTPGAFPGVRIDTLENKAFVEILN